MNPENPAGREFAARSYQLHAEHYSSYARDGGKAETARAWLRPDTVNAWRLDRMYSCADPLLDAYPDASWLTVGDGRYGLDAIYLRSRGAKALATDISGILLEEAKELGLIDDYRVENAEQLSFAPESFDFVFCKESYHHFPRPMCALHEMLRVARNAVLLVEPNDQACPRGFWGTMSRFAKDAIHRLGGRPTHHHRFEDVGNYVYTISRREMEKVALGMGLRTVAFKGVNDYFLPGIEFEPAIPESALFRKVARQIARYDFLCKLHISQPGLLAAVIFKRQPSLQARRALEDRGYDLVDLPENPWIAKSRTGG